MPKNKDIYHWNVVLLCWSNLKALSFVSPITHYWWKYPHISQLTEDAYFNGSFYSLVFLTARTKYKEKTLNCVSQIKRLYQKAFWINILLYMLRIKIKIMYIICSPHAFASLCAICAGIIIIIIILVNIFSCFTSGCQHVSSPMSPDTLLSHIKTLCCSLWTSVSTEDQITKTLF